MRMGKRILAGLLASLMLVAGMPLYGMEAMAAQPVGYEYKVNEDRTGIIITGYYGNGGDITIPSTIAGEKVVAIGEKAFYNCTKLTGVEIPEGVTSIEASAFMACNAITSIKIPQGVTSIEREAFMGCRKLTSVEIPKGVTSLEDNVFNSCDSLARVNIPENVTSIGAGAFSGCKNLTSISIPKSVTSIERGVFSGCKSLTSISIPKSVTSIREYAFSGCGLSSVTIPESVTSIGWSAFTDCYSLTGVTIPGKITDIGKWALGYSYNRPPEQRPANLGYEKDLNFIICGDSGSEAEKYAKENGFIFRSLSAEEPVKENIFKADITLAQDSCIYDGKAKTPSVTVKLGGKTLVLNTDYTVVYKNNINVGRAYVTVTGKGNYTGSKTLGFMIVEAEQPKPYVSCNKTMYHVAYGAKPFKISAVSNSKLAFTSSNPRIVSVDKNTGKATIKGTGIAAVTIRAGSESAKVTVKVSPKRQAVKSTKTGYGRRLTVKWAKDKMASGYQVQISLDRNYRKIAKEQNVSKTSCTFTKLKTGRKYYVRVRSYKKSGRETLYGAWSKARQSSKIKR